MKSYTFLIRAFFCVCTSCLLKNSVTPLQLAVQSGRQEVVMLLLGAGAGVDIPDKVFKAAVCCVFVNLIVKL